jgi:hypothetical protein
VIVVIRDYCEVERAFANVPVLGDLLRGADQSPEVFGTTTEETNSKFQVRYRALEARERPSVVWSALW